MPIKPLSSLVHSPTSLSREKQLGKLRLQLMLQRRWSYLRYVHFREGLLAAKHTKSLLVVGAGRAIAELALAIEFPEIQFHVTDVESDRTPNFKAAQKCVNVWGLPNVEFGVIDVTRPIDQSYDMVASIEVLEHIEDDANAMSHMVDAATKYLFCLVPYCDEESLKDPQLRARAWRRNEHYRYGYSTERLRTLLPNIVAMRGCYWKNQGLQLRLEITDLGNGAIRSRSEEFRRHAEGDVISELPSTIADAQGIWVLARTSPTPECSSSPDERVTIPGFELGTTLGRIEEIKKRLVVLRSWNFHRYLHLRQAFLETKDVRTVLSVACGRGLAELALALEFPETHFHLTGDSSPDTASARQVAELVRIWGLENISFGRHDILEGARKRYDMVCAMDVLAGIDDDKLAASNLISVAEKYVYAVVPFADAAAQSDETRRARAWKQQRRYRLGYTSGDLRELFPGESIIRGCYWTDGGGAATQASTNALDEQELITHSPQIWQDAERDIRDQIPQRYRQALGIWILANPNSR